ncbi:MAG: hypothetical protein IAF94_04045 [Pirellulaceae bacterium]|nr:hypothetical protein [Pirellulaceae bacterium]
MISAVPSQPPRPRWRWQFSLFTLLLVAIVACVVAAYLGTARRLEEAKATIGRQQADLKARDAEITKLEAELGILTITDPSKVHILALRSKEDWHWRWRVYLPPGKKWRITQALGERVPKQGFDMSNVPHGSSSGDLSNEEFTAEVWIARDVNGSLRLNRRFGGSGVANGISEEDAKKLLAGGSTSTHTAGMSATEVFDPAGPIELLRLHTHSHIPQPDGSSISSEKPDFGILLFLEEAR